MASSRVVAYYKRLMDLAKLQVASASRDYTQDVEASFRFFLENGFFSEAHKEREMKSYLKYAKTYCKYELAREKYYNVKRAESCQEESR